MAAPAVVTSYELPDEPTLRKRSPRQRVRFGRMVLIAVALSFLAAFVLLPLLIVFSQALAKGVTAYLAAIADPMAWAAIKLTLLEPNNAEFRRFADRLLEIYRAACRGQCPECRALAPCA